MEAIAALIAGVSLGAPLQAPAPPEVIKLPPGFVVSGQEAGRLRLMPGPTGQPILVPHVIWNQVQPQNCFT